jgi:hypothetical protein
MPEPTPGVALKRPAGRGHGKRGRWSDRAAGFGTLLVGNGLLALSQGDAQRAKLLERSESHPVEGLLQNACDRYAWLRLAIVQDYRGLPARKVAAPLMASLDLAPNLRGLWSTRAEYLLFYSTLLTSEELYEVRHQLRTIWSERPKRATPARTDRPQGRPPDRPEVVGLGRRQSRFRRTGTAVAPVRTALICVPHAVMCGFQPPAIALPHRCG